MFTKKAIQKSNSTAIAVTNVADIPPDMVYPGAVELFKDIRREYAKKLEESRERATNIRADLAVEEHRGQELERVLKELVPYPMTPNLQNSCPAGKAIQRSNAIAVAVTHVADVPPDMIYLGAVELSMYIRREYAKKLEESQERARKLRADLTVEEHRGQELERVLKELIFYTMTPNVQNSCPAGKTHHKVKGLPYFDTLDPIFDNDAANGGDVEDLVASVEAMNKEAYIETDANVEAEKQVEEKVDESFERSESLSVERITENHEKFSAALLKRFVNALDSSATCLKHKSDHYNKMSLASEELINMEGLTALQSLKVGRMICRTKLSVDHFLGLDCDRKELVDALLAGYRF